jgi:hypothetical protein
MSEKSPHRSFRRSCCGVAYAPFGTVKRDRRRSSAASRALRGIVVRRAEEIGSSARGWVYGSRDGPAPYSTPNGSGSSGDPDPDTDRNVFAVEVDVDVVREAREWEEEIDPRGSGPSRNRIARSMSGRCRGEPAETGPASRRFTTLLTCKRGGSCRECEDDTPDTGGQVSRVGYIGRLEESGW